MGGSGEEPPTSYSIPKKTLTYFFVAFSFTDISNKTNKLTFPLLLIHSIENFMISEKLHPGE